MGGSSKTLGLILIVVGAAIFLVVALFLGSGLVSGAATASGAILGIAIFGVLPLLLFGGVGAYLMAQGRAEATAMVDVRRKQQLLGLIQTQGKASLSTMMVELKVNRDTIKADIYELVQQGLFTGYINWPELTFYSADAQRVGSTKCPNCGGERELVGQGVVKCPYCGVELFIPPGAPSAQGVGVGM